MRATGTPPSRGRREHCGRGQPIRQRSGDPDGENLVGPARAPGRPHAARVPRALLAEGRAARARGAAGIRGPLRTRRAQGARRARRRRVAARRSRRPRYSLAHGPFRKADFRSLPARDWTLLVQGVNLHSDAADALSRRFAFVPFARLDDLMVEPGGARRWRRSALRFVRRVSVAGDRTPPLALRAPARTSRWVRPAGEDPPPVLPEHEAVLGPGDMLYLPPSFAHDGVAVDECTTYSIGFRAPSPPNLRGASSTSSATASHRGAVRRSGREPAREPARIAPSMQRRARRCCPGFAGAAPTSTDSWARAVGARARRVLRPPPAPLSRARSPLPRAARRRSARPARAVSLRRGATLRQRRSAIVAGGRRRIAELANARAFAGRASRASTRRLRSCTRLSPWLRPPRFKLTRRSSRARRARHGARAGRRDRRAGRARAAPPRVRRRSVGGGMAVGRARRATLGVPAPLALPRLDLIVHETRWLESSCPRLIALLRLQRVGHRLPDRSGGEGRVGSARHRRRPPLPPPVPHRPAARRARDRGAAVARSLVNRFDEIWATGEPGLTGTVLGL